MSDDLVKAVRATYAPPYVGSDKLQPLTHVLADHVEAQAAKIAGLRARVAGLEAALRPFADVGEFIAKHHPDPESDQNHETATLVRHFRAAYIALTGGKDE